MLRDPDRLVVHMEMLGATGLYPNILEGVSYSYLSEDAPSSEHHPMHIDTDGELLWFDGNEPQPDEDELSRLGLLAYQRFRGLVEELAPSYAALGIEEDVSAPYDLDDADGRFAGAAFVDLESL